MYLDSVSRSPEADLHKCSYKKMFWKYAASLQKNTTSKCDFNKVAT